MPSKTGVNAGLPHAFVADVSLMTFHPERMENKAKKPKAEIR